MPLPLGPNFVLEEVTREDLAIASLAWGFTLGFGWLTTWAAVKQTFRIWKRYGTRSIHNTYIWLIWLEILVCAIFSVICWLYLWGNIGPRYDTLVDREGRKKKKKERGGGHLKDIDSDLNG